MRANRTYGSEGGEGESPSLPLSLAKHDKTPSMQEFVIPANAGIHSTGYKMGLNPEPNGSGPKSK